MKRTMMALTAFAAAAAFTTGFAAASQASGPNAGLGSSQETAQASSLDAAAVCSAVADEHRAVWAGPSATGATVGGVTAGRTYDADCALVPGGTYTACGATTSQWAYVNYSGDNWGYVPSTCLTWAS